jgi:tetratricopeptide (TPR) repeat protein
MDIVLEGRRKNWQRRWFVVEGTNLEYYAHPNDRQLGIPPKGKVVLNDFRIQRGDVEHVAGYAKPSFALVSSSREFLLACDTDDERGGWMVHLQSILDKVVGRVAVADASVEKATEHYRQGNKHLLEQQDQLAIAEYTRSIGLNPAYEDAYYNRGIAYLNTGCNAALAITDFTQVIKMNP